MASFLGEIKRRKVFQVAAAYAVVAWLLIQVITAVEGPLSLPPWTDTLVIVLLAVGFPVAVLVSWAFEVTPDGLVRDRGGELAARTDGRRTGLVLAVLLALAVVWIAYGEFRGTDRPQVLPNSVAVLPFENLSPNPDDAYFAAGIHEEVLNQLAQLGDLTVIARTTMLRFADRGLSIPEIARELNVETVMEGSVRYANGRVRITAQLIDPVTGGHLWSEAYERSLSDIFSIQTDIARQITTALEAELTPAEQRLIEEPPSASPEALPYYLRALTHVPDIEPGVHTDETAQIISFLDEALALDPNYSAAIAFKAFNFAMSRVQANRRTDLLTSADREVLARQLAEQALEINPNIGLAYTALGLVHLFNLDYAQALPYLEEAYEISPSDSDVLQEYALGSALLGRDERVAEIIEQLLRVNPDDLFFKGYIEQVQGRRDAAVETYRLALEVTPSHAGIMAPLAVLEAARGETDVAIERLRTAQALAPNLSPTYLTYVAYGYGRAGANIDARKVFDSLDQANREYRLGPGNLAMAYLAIGDERAALEQLRAAAESSTAGEGIMSLWDLIYNNVGDPVLEQQEFVEVRRALGARD